MKTNEDLNLYKMEASAGMNLNLRLTPTPIKHPYKHGYITHTRYCTEDFNKDCITKIRGISEVIITYQITIPKAHHT
jgi:hypothetical protein